MPNVFICYRRDDSPYLVGDIYAHLVSRFGREAIFRDIDAIPPGVDYRQQILAWVQACDVVLVIIGDRWLRAEYIDGPKKGQHRLQDPNDDVRLEIETALARQKSVIPVLANGASMPEREDENVPLSLRALPCRNAVVVRPDPDLQADLCRLTQAIEESVQRPLADITEADMVAARAALIEESVQRPPADITEADMAAVRAARIEESVQRPPADIMLEPPPEDIMPDRKFQVTFHLIQILGDAWRGVLDARGLIRSWFTECGLDAHSSDISMEQEASMAWGTVSLEQRISAASRSDVLSRLNNRLDQLVSINGIVVRARVTVGPPADPSKPHSRLQA